MTDYIKREDAMAEFKTNGSATVYGIDKCKAIISRLQLVPAADVVERDSAEYEWCTDCKEYDHERHCCPRWNKVIRDTVDEIRRNADVVEVVRCKDCKYSWHFNGCLDGMECDSTNPDFYCARGERAEA